MCGLVGYSGSAKPNIAALKLMSVNIRDRGKDSVGFLINDIVSRGLYESYQKDYADPLMFFSRYTFNRSIRSKWTSNTVMIHNRSATRGLRTAENSHPFVYEKDGVTHYFCHNGTLTNEQELCQLYGLNSLDFAVDSKLLGYIIVHHGFDVLKQYKGAAAFLYYRNDEPNTLYVFKGESLFENKLEEERPLYFIKEKKGTFFASTDVALECSLDAPVNSAISLKSNTVFKVTEGNFQEVVFIDRTTIENKPPVVVTKTTHITTGYNNYQKTIKKDNEYPGSAKTDMPKLCLYKNPEKNPQGKSGNKVYYYKGLYFKNGHYISGVYALKDDGSTNDNIYYDELFVPQFRNPEGNTEFTTYFFYFGYWIKDAESYNFVKKTARTQEEMHSNLHKILHHLHDEYHLFFYEYSELKQCNVLKIYNRGALMYAEVVNRTPRFALYSYKFLIRDNKYIVDKIKNEDKVVNLPATFDFTTDEYNKHPWQEDLFTMNF
jgi:hypothetical protein